MGLTSTQIHFLFKHICDEIIIRRATHKRELYKQLWVPAALRQLIPHFNLVTSLKFAAHDHLLRSPSIRYTSATPLSVKFTNYREPAKSLTMDEILHIAHGNCDCATRPHLIPQGCEHVISMAPTGVLPHAVEDFCFNSSRCRLHEPIQDIAAVLVAFDACVDRFCRELSSNRADDLLDDWANEVKNGVHAEILKIQLSGGPTHFKDPIFTPDIHRSYRQATGPYIVTLMDKNGANFVIVCKKHYFRCLLTDLYGQLPPLSPLPPECSAQRV